MPENKVDRVLSTLKEIMYFTSGIQAYALCEVCDIKTKRELRGHISHLRMALGADGTFNVASGDYGYHYTDDIELLRATTATLGAKIRGIQAAIDGLNNTIKEIEGNKDGQLRMFDR